MISEFKAACKKLPFPCSFDHQGHLVTAIFTGDGWAMTITLDSNTGDLYPSMFDRFADEVTKEIKSHMREMSAS